MDRRLVLLASLTLAASAFAGCTTEDGDGGATTTTTSTPATTTTPTVTTPETTTPVTSTPAVTTPPTPPGGIGNETFAVATTGVPAIVREDTAFTVTVYANGSESISSDHIGAHYASAASASPSLETYPGACEHKAGALPGEFSVSCNFTESGTWYLRGHARVTSANQTYNYWGPEVAIKVVNVSLNATGVPTAIAANQTFTFNLNVTTNQTLTTDHIGAHWGWASTTSPSTTTYPQSCVHQAGTLPGVFIVTCQLPGGGLTPTTAFLRGHVRVTEGDTQVNVWTPEFEITVSGLPI